MGADGRQAWLEQAHIARALDPEHWMDIARDAVDTARAAGNAEDEAFALGWWAFASARNAALTEVPPRLAQIESRLRALSLTRAGPAWLLRDARAALALRQGDARGCLDLVTQNLNPSPRWRAPLERCLSLMLAGQASLRLGDFEGSLRHRFHHADVAAASGDRFELAASWHAIGHWHATQYNHDDAVPAFEEALRLWSEVIAPRWRGVNVMSLVTVLIELDRSDDAWTWTRRWLDQPGGPPEGRHGVLGWAPVIGGLLVRRGDLDGAREWLAHGGASMDTFVRRPAAWHHAQSLWLLAHGRADEARQLCASFLSAERPRVIVDDPQTRLVILETLERACADLGDRAGERDAARRIRALLLPLVARSAKAQYMTLKVLRDVGRSAEVPPEAAPHDDRRIAAIDHATQAFERVEPIDADALAAAPVRDATLLASVTHELRTPLHGVLGLTSMLLLSKLDDQQRRLLGMTRHSAEHMLRVVNDILDLGKVEAGRLDIRRRRFELAPVLREVIGLFEADQAHRGLRMRVQIERGTPAFVDGDAGRIAQVLINFVGNAVKFTREGEVVLRAQPLDDGDTVRLEVEDTGIGVPAEMQPLLFNESVQVAVPADMIARGSGLGLTLCKRLAALMGARVGMSSDEGVGSRFWLDLPLHRTCPA